MIRNELVYENDFENNNLNKIDGGNITRFNNTNVLGNFNNDSFTIFLDEIGVHDYVFISFDLYIHGSWDGNSNGFETDDKPDLWGIEINPGMDLFNDPSIANFTTTFSNSSCWPNYCLIQSYPETYPYNNNPKTGYSEVDLDVICANNFFGGQTTLYKIQKSFKSSGENLVLRFFDELYQPNAIDKDGIPQQKCDESWSVDNIKIRVVNYR